MQGPYDAEFFSFFFIIIMRQLIEILLNLFNTNWNSSYQIQILGLLLYRCNDDCIILSFYCYLYYIRVFVCLLSFFKPSHKMKLYTFIREFGYMEPK